ncbi:hypothetical protein OG455_29870 [Kitasatospora sp. NBC_01287]|uniref:hypothetical protein n=1 Tax=Kitasatospora sp. NBC_01287 TaxID=2903573 RepID=UPI00224C9A6D|nr:hypothetical protein [Kitasatospora sp. NBC_01287]MCX4749673.1 hypothetical protein [Kitasatospora sp. NBC_01287]
MACVHRAVLLRAAAAALVLAAAFGGEHAVGHALAKRGAELAAHQHHAETASQDPGQGVKKGR